jgi:hypothetical protein
LQNQIQGASEAGPGSGEEAEGKRREKKRVVDNFLEKVSGIGIV